jgi:hypothetical protein
MGLEGSAASSALCRSRPIALPLAGRPWREELGEGSCSASEFIVFLGVPLDPGAPTLRLVVFFTAGRQASMGEADGFSPEDGVPFQ